VLVEFGGFGFDDATRELRCGPRLVHLSPKAVDLLALLLRERPRAVSKGELHATLWPGTFVTDGNLAVLVTEIRRALADSAHDPRFIRTVSRYGYAFVGTPGGASAVSREPAASLFLPGGQRVALRPGENIVGRDPGADVHIDAVGVSRRHAEIVIRDGQAVVRDLASKNGTFVQGERIGAPAVLADHSELRFGTMTVLFRTGEASAPTQTVPVPDEGGTR
jgi:DNA-binding winged helix-turn-helix (wHTH) protein